MSEDDKQSDVIEKQCRVGSAHESHQWTYQPYVDDVLAHGYPPPKRIDVTQHSCVGVGHADHDVRCCTIQGTHAKDIHIGCILR